MSTVSETSIRPVRRVLFRGRTATYHVIARTAGQAMLFGPEEKEMFRRQMRAVALFCGIRVVTFCIMGNHVHLLVEVPSERPDLADGELLRRSAALYGGRERSRHALRLETIERALAEGDEPRERMRAMLLGRMCDLSMFAKLLQQRYSIWYNRTHERHGTLWSGRFKSVLVEGKGLPVAVVAAYIDLNAVRAGIVDDPLDYRWCGFAEAAAGLRAAKDGICRIDGGSDTTKALARYGVLLYAKGTAPGRDKPTDATIPEELWREARERYGTLTPFASLRQRVRYMTAGAILGSSLFIEEWFCRHQSAFPKRISGPRKLRGGDWGSLRTFRDLRKDVCSDK
ncbi:MAG: transposase [Opitutales bacterium]|nr:transposase [Opitutales bacterium]